MMFIDESVHGNAKPNYSRMVTIDVIYTDMKQ